jgi:hypothetical protein
MFLGSKVRLVHRADNLTAISEPNVQTMGIISISQPYGTSRTVMGIIEHLGNYA